LMQQRDYASQFSALVEPQSTNPRHASGVPFTLSHKIQLRARG
jgi:hypothetical protein